MRMTLLPRRWDRERFAALVSRHQAALWRYLRYLGCEGAQADDLVQDTFLAIWERPFREYSERATARYLRQAARRQFLMALRHQRVRPLFQDLHEAEAAWESFCGSDGGNRYRDALQLCLDEIGDRARTALDLFYAGTRSRDHVAQALTMTVEGVKTLLRRSRATLRECVMRRLS